jgi:hypothetical protein
MRGRQLPQVDPQAESIVCPQLGHACSSIDSEETNFRLESPWSTYAGTATPPVGEVDVRWRFVLATRDLGTALIRLGDKRCFRKSCLMLSNKNPS